MPYFELILVAGGFIVLIKGAGWLVDGASSIARRFGISQLIVGLTVVSFGTSSPELFVNILSAIRGNTDLALGNIIGSNISNTLLIIGIAALIYPLRIKRATVWREIPLGVLAGLVVFVVANDKILEGAGSSIITRIDGLVLLSIFVIFLYYAFITNKASGASEDSPTKQRKPMLAIGMVVAGFISLALGGKLIVDGAIGLAAGWGISERMIGLTIVAIGTSLPELAASAVAAFKKNAAIAIGNVVGSNLFNLLFVLAVTSTIRPLPVSPELNSDMLIMIFAALLLFTAAFTGTRKHLIDRKEGAVFLGIYALYITYLIIGR